MTIMPGTIKMASTCECMYLPCLSELQNILSINGDHTKGCPVHTACVPNVGPSTLLKVNNFMFFNIFEFCQIRIQVLKQGKETFYSQSWHLNFICIHLKKTPCFSKPNSTHVQVTNAKKRQQYPQIVEPIWPNLAIVVTVQCMLQKAAKFGIIPSHSYDNTPILK